MPTGENLTQAHQSAAGRKPRLRGSTLPRAALDVLNGKADHITQEQWEQIKYRIDAVKLEMQEMESAKARGELLTVDEAREAFERLHQLWMQEGGAMSTLVAGRVPDLPPAIRDRVLTAIDEAWVEVRRRVAEAP